jgi:hypothetical protein
MSMGVCWGIGKAGESGSDKGEPDAIGGVENIIGGGGMTDAGELNLFKSQLTPEAGVALANDGDQED